mmetsp:Transcript_24846/g.68819  ORF Transcript_24846/g.68819 Transcript_24846/m.68819 type:complete len:142 (-) Transcript_24846:86-511(-)
MNMPCNAKNGIREQPVVVNSSELLGRAAKLTSSLAQQFLHIRTQLDDIRTMLVNLQCHFQTPAQIPPPPSQPPSITTTQETPENVGSSQVPQSVVSQTSDATARMPTGARPTFQYQSTLHFQKTNEARPTKSPLCSCLVGA